LNRDLNWLDQVAPLIHQKPALATDVGRTYLNVAQAQWSDDQASLKDVDGSLATCKKAFALLSQLPETSLNTDAVRELESDLERQVNSLPTTHQ
jgi:hypothetical protein